MSVLSANFKKCRFCNFSGSYTKRSPSEKWSWAKTHSVIVTGASWVHFNPRKTKIGQKKSLTPFCHRDLQLIIGLCVVQFRGNRVRNFKLSSRYALG